MSARNRSSRGSAPGSTRSRGHACSCRYPRTCGWAAARRGRSSSLRYRTPTSPSWNEWAPKILAKIKTLPELRDVATDQQTEGTTLQLTINRDTAARFGIQPQLIDDTLYDAFGQRQVAQYFTQVNTYHVILEITPEMQGKLDTLDKIYLKSPRTGEQVPLAVFCSWTDVPVRPLAIAHHRGSFQR
jgi:multidrug efflux pump subunit AcrB